MDHYQHFIGALNILQAVDQFPVIILCIQRIALMGVDPDFLVRFFGDDRNRRAPPAKTHLIAEPDGLVAGRFGYFDQRACSIVMELYWFFAVSA